MAVVRPFQVTLRLQEPVAPRLAPPAVRPEDPPGGAGAVHLDLCVLVPQGDDERVVGRIVGERVGVRPVGRLAGRVTEREVGVLPEARAERAVADAVRIEGVQERPLRDDRPVGRELDDDVAHHVLRLAGRVRILVARGVVVEGSDLRAQRHQVSRRQLDDVVVQRVGVDEDAARGGMVRGRAGVPAAHDVAEDVHLDQDAPDAVQGAHVEQVAVRERDGLHDRVVGPVVPDDLPRRIHRDQETEVLVVALLAPPVDVEQRPARLHPLRAAHGRFQRRKVLRQGIRLDDQGRRPVLVACGVRGDERDGVRAPGAEPDERNDVLRPRLAAELQTIHPRVVGDLDGEPRGLVRVDLDRYPEWGLGTRRLRDVQPRNRRRRPVARHRCRTERGDCERQRAARGRNPTNGSDERTVYGTASSARAPRMMFNRP